MFRRRDLVFGLDLALPHIIKYDSVFICEGLFDVISMHEAGFKNVVATLGTTITPQQLQALRFFTNNLVFAFDGDSAGQAATIFARALAQSMSFHVDALTFPEGEDPNSLFNKKGVLGFTNFVTEQL